MSGQVRLDAACPAAIRQATMAAYERREQREKVVLGPSLSAMLERFAAPDLAA